MKLTPQDIVVLKVLCKRNSGDASSIAKHAGFTTAWPAETAARHLSKLSKMGFARRHARTYGGPFWVSTDAGRAALPKDDQSEVAA